MLNPSAEDIRAAVLGLDASGDAFLILGPDEMSYVQCGGDAKTGFDFEYQDGSVERHFRAKQTGIDAETIIAKFVGFAAGDVEWVKDLEWEHITW